MQDRLLAVIGFLVLCGFLGVLIWKVPRLDLILLCGTTVVGGASKLFAEFCRRHNPTSVISYSDKRWNTGGLYKQLGFDHAGESGPNYWYSRRYNSMESRVKYQKHKLINILEVFDESLTEWENMVANGYDRYWDCGNSVWVWKNNSKSG